MVDLTFRSNSKPGMEGVNAVAGQYSTGASSNPQDLPLSGISQPASSQHVSAFDFASGATGERRLAFFEASRGQMKKLLDAAYKAALTSAPILLTGERGVGKSVLARQIHEKGLSHEQAFVVVNCTSISKRSLENKPFHQVIASLVGMHRNRRQRADILRGSTIFFDNISDLSELGQLRLVQFLEDQNFQPIFEQNASWTPYRIIAACNRDLALRAATKRFRKDLFFKINVVSLEIPPLRDRLEDIQPLANYLLSNVSLVIERPGLQLAPDAMTMLTRYRWPGNVRELLNVIERVAILTRSNVITSWLLTKAMGAKNASGSVALHPPTTLREVERHHIAQILSQTESLEQAATALGITLPTLWRKRRRYDLE